ncbi:MAG: hypothetical protein NUK65_12590, partial [Firmicutes bacterium]|nr:hypothetical protein [Bacillota bacterium]
RDFFIAITPLYNCFDRFQYTLILTVSQILASQIRRVLFAREALSSQKKGYTSKVENFVDGSSYFF